MSRRNAIPSDHLIHLLRKNHRSDLDRFAKGLEKNDPDVRRRALDFLESREPGTAVRLQELWQFSTQHSEHIWRLPCMERKSLRAAVLTPKDMSNGVWASFNDPTPHATATPDDDVIDADAEGSARRRKPAWIFGATVTERTKRIEASAWVYLNRTTSYEGHDSPLIVTHAIKAVADFTYNQRIIRVAGDYEESRQAIFALAKWITGEDIPLDAGRERDEYFVSVNFVESDVKRLASRKHWKNIGFRSKDPTAKNGDAQFWGKMEGARRSAVDLSDRTVKGYEQSLGRLRQYEVPFVHEDGYKERGVVEFVLQGRQPHMTYKTRVSQALSKMVLDELCTDLGIT